MPTLKINGVNYYYEETGSGAETIIFSHGFLWSGKMYVKQVETFQENYRVITYDHRGQGQTEVTADGYDMDTLTADAVALIQALDAAPCHFVGLSMGGYVGMRLASRHAELLKSVTLLDTRADPETFFSRLKFRIIGLMGRYLPPNSAIDTAAMKAMFGKTFIQDANRADEYAYWRQQINNNDAIGIYRALIGVINRQGVVDELPNITIPTLIMVGDEDTATVPAKSEAMHHTIPQSRLVIIRNAGHSSTIEQPDQVIVAMQDFLTEITTA